MLSPSTQDEVREAVLSLPQVRVRGGGTKMALSAGANLSMSMLIGILEYEPGEFTFTALAGTPLSVVRDALATNGQYLPFDPPWISAGATLGGTVAAGLSGPGRFQYGGVRDFLLGVRVVTGDGRVVRGGGKVVKNAAGFDIPKLLVGSLGRLGVITEVSFKVFPAPAATATVLAEYDQLSDAVDMLQRLAASRLALAALELEPGRAANRSSVADGARPPFSSGARLSLRLGGLQEALPARISRVKEFLGANARIEVESNDTAFWQSAAEFDWQPPGHALVKLPLISSQIVELERALQEAQLDASRRYSVGGNVAWLAWPDAVDQQVLFNIAQRLGRPLLVVSDRSSPQPQLAVEGNPLWSRLRSVFDPGGKFAA